MITIKNLNYSIGSRYLFQDVNFSIPDKDRVAIVGPNGAGKSTLIKIITGKLSPDSGKVIFDKRKKDIVYMPQHLADLGPLPKMTVLDFMLSGRGLDIISKNLAKLTKEMNRGNVSSEKAVRLAQNYSDTFESFLHKEGYRAEDDLLEILLGMGLSSLDLDQKIQTLSGGQKTKLAFARVLFSKADVMILDEPTNHLDEKTIDYVVDYLKTYPKTLIMVSHVASVLDQLISRVISLDGRGGISITKGNYSDYREKDKTNKEISEKAYEAQKKEEERLMRFISRWRGNASKISQVHDREKKLAKLRSNMIITDNESARITPSFPVSHQPHRNVLTVTNISKVYGGKRVLNNVSFEIKRGEKIAIIGPNGAGKTTLLRIINDQINPEAGNVSLGDKVSIGFYSQEHESLNNANKVIEEASSNNTLPPSTIRSVLAHFLFPGERAQTRVGSLSLGERSRLALAKLVVSGCNFLILDEPTNHLDILARHQVKEALKTYKGTVLIVTHDRDFIQGIGVEKVLLLPDNKFGFLDQLVNE